MPRHDHHQAATHHDEAAKLQSSAAEAHEHGDAENGDAAFPNCKRRLRESAGGLDRGSREDVGS